MSSCANSASRNALKLASMEETCTAAGIAGSAACALKADIEMQVAAAADRNRLRIFTPKNLHLTLVGGG